MYVVFIPERAEAEADSLVQLDSLENDFPAFAAAGDASVPAGPPSPLLHLPLSFAVSREPLQILPHACADLGYLRRTAAKPGCLSLCSFS